MNTVISTDFGPPRCKSQPSMDLRIHSLDDLLLTAVKSEIESRDFYSEVSGAVRNALLKDRLEFLSREEEKHRIFFERLFKERFPQKELVLPEKSPVPLPQLRIESENTPISEVLARGMDAELAAHDFYTSLAARFDDKPEIKHALHYIASMEMGHYRILELERESAQRFEAVDFEWPMMHIGP